MYKIYIFYSVYLCKMSIDYTRHKVYIIISSREQENNRISEGGREYRKGKQEYHITPGNRIREIEMH